MFLKRLIAMHAPSCGNGNLQFRLDVDEFQRDGTQDQRFVASFYRYGALDLFGGSTALEAMDLLIDGVLTWYNTEEGKRLIKQDSPVSNDICHHGTDDKLIAFALQFSGLSKDDQAAVRERL